MTAKIRGFITRENAGLRAPRSVSRNVTPARGGVALHYGGGRQAAAEPGADHQRCIDTWRSWQRFHMAPGGLGTKNGAADVAYTGAVCNHGFAFAGRGSGVRTGAQGTNVGNQNYYGIVWIGGMGQTPTVEAFAAFDWWIKTLREAGAGLAVKTHVFFRSTACPGSPISVYAASRDGKRNIATASTPNVPEPTPTNDQVRRIQQVLRVRTDGMWGPKTDARAMRLRNAAWSRRGWPSNRRANFNIRDVQEVIGTRVDGVWGPLSQAALTNWIVRLQRVINVKGDGWWGPKTDGKLIQLRRKYLNNF